MCLNLADRFGKASKKRFVNGKFTAYKIFVIISNSYEATEYNGKLRAYHFGKTHYANGIFFIYLPAEITRAGFYTSNRKDKKFSKHEKKCNLVNRGIHVYLKKPAFPGSNLVVVPMVCYEKDLVAFGKHDQAVFMKVKIKHKKHRKLFKEKR